MRGERTRGGGRAAALLLAVLAPGACQVEPEDPDVTAEVDAAVAPDARTRPDAKMDRAPSADVGLGVDGGLPRDASARDTTLPDAGGFEVTPDQGGAPDARPVDAKPSA